MIEQPELFRTAQRDAYDAIAEHYGRIQSGLWTNGFFWRSFQGAMAVVVVLGGVVTLRPPAEIQPGSWLSELAHVLPMHTPLRGPVLHVLLVGVFVFGILVLAVAGRAVIGRSAGTRIGMAGVFWFCVITPSYLLFASWFLCFGAGDCSPPESAAWAGAMDRAGLLVLLLNAFALLLAACWTFASGSLGWWLPLITSKSLPAAGPSVFPSYDDVSAVVLGRLRGTLAGVDTDALASLLQQSRQKRDSLSAQLDAAGPATGALGLGGLLATLFTQQELRMGMAHVESFFWRDQSGILSLLLGLLVVAVIILAVRWFLAVAVTMRVLDGMIFTVHELLAVPRAETPSPHAGYALKTGILVPLPRANDHLRPGGAPRGAR
jgi:hypothetical protein